MIAEEEDECKDILGCYNKGNICMDMAVWLKIVGVLLYLEDL
jgi:hypothetical protein